MPPRQPKYPRNEHGLTPGQQTFADLFRSGPKEWRGNALACYQKAFPRASLRTAKTQSSRLLRNPAVTAYLQSKRRAAEKKADVDEARILQELVHLGFSDIRALFDEEGRLRPIHRLPAEVAAAVSAVDVVAVKGKEGDEPLYVHKIKLWNKLEALEKLGKQLGMFKEQKSMKVEGEITYLLQEIAGDPLSTPMGRVKAAQEGTLPDYDEPGESRS
jgi:phage terminase small subunit